jgi:hypothetical protein
MAHSKPTGSVVIESAKPDGFGSPSERGGRALPDQGPAKPVSSIHKAPTRIAARTTEAKVSGARPPKHAPSGESHANKSNNRVSIPRSAASARAENIIKDDDGLIPLDTSR